MDELTTLEKGAARLLARLQPDDSRALARKIGTELRRSQSQHSGKQQDSPPYAPRKQQLRQKSERVNAGRCLLSHGGLNTSRSAPFQCCDHEIQWAHLPYCARASRGADRGGAARRT